jgi:hypothetical protein
MHGGRPQSTLLIDSIAMRWPSGLMVTNVVATALLAAVVIATNMVAHSASTAAAAQRRHVRWYHASGAMADVAINDRWLSVPQRRAAITGAYACCNFWMMNASTGKLIADVAGNSSQRFAPFLSRGLTVHAHGMLSELALKRGVAHKSIPALAQL